jgi:hypothetical protein
MRTSVIMIHNKICLELLRIKNIVIVILHLIWFHKKRCDFCSTWALFKGGFKSEDTEEFFRCQNKYSKSLS